MNQEVRKYKKAIKNCEKCGNPFEVNQNCAWNTKYCISCRKEKRKIWKRIYEKKWFADRPGLKAVYCRRYYEKYKDVLVKSTAEYHRKRPDIRKKCWTKYNKKVAFLLTPATVKSILAQTVGIPRYLIPIQLIEEKRALMLLNRQIKQIKKEIYYEKIEF